MINWVKKKIIIFIVIKVTEVSGWHANTHTKRQIIAEKRYGNREGLSGVVC